MSDEIPDYAKSDWEAKSEVERVLIRALHNGRQSTPYASCTTCAETVGRLLRDLAGAGYRVEGTPPTCSVCGAAAELACSRKGCPQAIIYHAMR